MKSSQTYLILLLAATTAGGAMLAWRQYGELVELRAAAMNKDERADLQKRLWELEKSNRDLQNRLSAPGGTGEADALLAAADGEGRPSRDRGGRGGDQRGRGGFEQQAAAVRDLMNKPEVQALLSLQQKAGIEARYSTLFKNLNLPPDQIEKLTALLGERSTTMQDVMSAARDQGINPRENPDAFRKLVADAQNEINKSIKSVIGDQGFAQLSNYEQTLPQRNVVNELQQRLSYTSTPLTAAQAEQMVQILATNTPPRTAAATSAPPVDARLRMGPPPSGGGRGPDVSALLGAIGGPGLGMMVGAPDGDRGAGTVVVTPAAVVQAQTVLAPTQVAALQQIQQQQAAQQQLRQLLNETLSAGQPAGRGAPAKQTKGGG